MSAITSGLPRVSSNTAAATVPPKKTPAFQPPNTNKPKSKPKSKSEAKPKPKPKSGATVKLKNGKTRRPPTKVDLNLKRNAVKCPLCKWVQNTRMQLNTVAFCSKCKKHFPVLKYEDKLRPKKSEQK